MAKFLMKELILAGDVQTARLGAGTGAANWVDDKEVDKPVKMVGESRYDLAAAGDPIQGFVKSLESATLDDYSIGSVQIGGRKEVTFDGLEATPGTGTVGMSDYVVTGTVVVKGTALTVPPKVTKATNQPGAAIALGAVTITEPGLLSDVDELVNAAFATNDTQLEAAFAKFNSQLKNAAFGWRVVSLGTVGTGAVGTVGVIERVK